MKIQMNKRLLLAATMVTVLNITSCSKYDDGPAFSLRSKTARLTGEWEVKEINGQSPSSDGEELIFEFEKDGDFQFTYAYDNYSYSYKGDWEWEDNKETIEIDVQDVKIDFEVKRLTNTELWMEDEDGQDWELEKI